MIPTQHPKVSVIVPIYKVEKYLVQCLDSIINQTLRDIEIILIDEGDHDACRYIIDHYEQTDSRVRGIHENNGGYGRSVNKGFELARGEFISIIESDDFIDSRMLEDCFEIANKFNADVVATPYYEYWDKSRESPERKEIVWWTKYFTKVPSDRIISAKEYPQFLGVHPSIWAKLYRKSYLDKNEIRCIEARGAGYIDHLLRAQIMLMTDKLVWNPKPYYHYRLSNENASSAAGMWDIKTMLQRWSEVHDWIKMQHAINYDDFASWMIREEYVCTLDKMLSFPLFRTQENISALIENFKYTKVEHIENSLALNKKEKKKALRFMETVKDASDFKRYCVEVLSDSKDFVPTIRIKLFGLIPMILCKKTSNRWKVFLFDVIPLLSIRS
ncbi:glycosyltransferase [Sutterella sp.]|uniref:glycosyltransferase n=1 Tax=Sutterella sp. TaxID=1981025 RepID=UPI003FD74597